MQQDIYKFKAKKIEVLCYLFKQKKILNGLKKIN